MRQTIQLGHRRKAHEAIGSSNSNSKGNNSKGDNNSNSNSRNQNKTLSDHNMALRETK
jgi:hypothetical protein